MHRYEHTRTSKQPSHRSVADPLNYTQPSPSILRKGHPRDVRRKDKRPTITKRHTTLAKDLRTLSGQYNSCP